MLSLHVSQSSDAANSSQVTALLVSGDDLYVGTTGGRVFILDKVAMTTVTMLHCHGDDTPYIRAILPLPRPHQTEEDQDLLPGQDTDVFTNSGVVTIGKGYREMFGRFLGRHQLKVDKSLTYILCWMHEHWRLCQDSDWFRMPTVSGFRLIQDSDWFRMLIDSGCRLIQDADWTK